MVTMINSVLVQPERVQLLWRQNGQRCREDFGKEGTGSYREGVLAVVVSQLSIESQNATSFMVPKIHRVDLRNGVRRPLLSKVATNNPIEYSPAR